MATGTGKSAVFQTVAYLEGQAAANSEKKPPVTIVVVPLVALIADHLRECKDIPGILAGGWEQRNMTGLNLLFISVEHTLSIEFKRLLVVLANEHRLTRIVVDECHLTMLWCSFRSSMLQLGFNIQHRSLRIQRILLSATVPPQQMEEMARMHGLISGFELLRQPSTARSNLSYQVRRCEVPPLKFNQQKVEMVNHTYAHVRNELDCIAEDIASKPESYLRNNSTAVRVDSDSDSTTSHDEAVYQVSKQQILVYSPFKEMVETCCQTLHKNKIQSEEIASSKKKNNNCRAIDDGDHDCDLEQDGTDVHVIVVVSDVMSFHAGLNGQVKEIIHDKWMTKAGELHKSQTKSALRRFQSLARDRLQGDKGGNSRRRKAVVVIVLVQIVVATCTFGTGINSPHVRVVIHIGVSRSLMEYAQESGRAGRDGLPARCIVVYNSKFAEKMADIVTMKIPDNVRACMSNVQGGAAASSSASNTMFSSSAYLRQAQQAFAQQIIWLETSTQCRRTSLFQHLDDFPTNACIHEHKTISQSPCDYCSLLICDEIVSGPVRNVDEVKEISIPLGRREITVRAAVRDNRLPRHVNTDTGSHAQNIPRPAALTTRPNNTTVPEQVEGSSPVSRTEKNQGQGTFSAKERKERVSHQSGATDMKLDDDDDDDGEEENVIAIIRKASEREGESHAATMAEEDEKEECPNLGEILAVFKQHIDDVLSGKCVYCFARKGISHEVTAESADRCVIQSKACFRCFRQGCRSGVCSIYALLRRSRGELSAHGKSSGLNPCTTCGFLYFHGAFIHCWGRFGPNCQYRGALQVCLGAWYVPATRKLIVDKYSLEEDWNSPKEKHIHAFFKWLHEMDEENTRYNFMNVFWMITKSVAS